jgi:biopolymer transport protein ExbD
MAVKIKRRTKPSTEVPAASLPDIAFLLLIFFLSTTTFSLEEGLVLALPTQESKEVKINRKNIMTIQAHPTGVVTVDDEPVRIRDIRQLVIDAQKENDKLVVVMETHPDAPYELMVDVLDELKMAQTERIALKTMEVE